MSFTEASLEHKLADLNNSQQSIQQLALWIIHHRKHYASIVKIWTREVIAASSSRKLTFLYLANDVVQNSRKKHPEYAKEYGTALKKVLDHMTHIKFDEKTVKSVGRLLKIWQERHIFDPKVQTDLQKLWAKKVAEVHPDEPPAKKIKPSVVEHKSPPVEESNGSSLNDSSASGPDFKALLASACSFDTSSPAPSTSEPPEPEVLIKALQDLESSASSDAATREKIARLPPELSEASYLETIDSVEKGQQFLAKINQANELLTAYNKRLQEELQERQRVSKMLSDFHTAQKDLLSQGEERLELYRDKLDKINGIRADLKSHIQSLPDLTKLPDVTGGLAPLPSAGDLFTHK